MENKIIHIAETTRNSKFEESPKEVSDKKQFKLLKLLSGKNLKIIVLCMIILVALIMYIGLSDSSGKSAKVNASNESSGYQTTLEYCSKIESKLERLLSNIAGAGQVTVMITVDGSPELVYASDTDSKTSSTNAGSTTTTSSSPIIVSNTALILTENLPKVKGVIVVSSGAAKISIKLDILNAVSTLLDISTDKISVLKGI